MALPKNVIKKDHDLMQDYEGIGMEIMELRWHWTLNEANPKRVSLREYAREVGRAYSTIAGDAKAHSFARRCSDCGTIWVRGTPLR